MPTPDASAFTRQAKLRSVSAQARDSNQKVLTHLYQYAPTAASITDFLPSFVNKTARPLTLGVKNAVIGRLSTMNNGYRQNGLPVKRIK